MNWLKWARYRIVKMFFYKLVFNSQKCPNFGIIARLNTDAFKRFLFPSLKLCEIDENLRSLKRQNSDTFDCVKCVEKQNRKCLLKRVNSTFVTAWVPLYRIPMDILASGKFGSSLSNDLRNMIRY